MSSPERAARTRIKICGLTREKDVDAAVAAGADAVGFVLYSQSPRFVSAARAAELASRLQPFVTSSTKRRRSPRFVWRTHACKRDRWHLAGAAALQDARR